jgi:C-terminal peptidase prc
MNRSRNPSYSWLLFALITVLISSLIGYWIGKNGPFSSQEDTSPAAAQWQATGLDFNLMRGLFESPICLRGPSEIKGCLAALESLLSHFPQSAQLIPSSQSVKNGWQRIWQSHPLAIDYSTKKIATTSSQKISTGKSNMVALEQILLRKAQNEIPLVKAALSSLGRWIDSEIINTHPKTAALWIAQSFNTYLAVAIDPHSRLIPRPLEGRLAHAPGTQDSNNNYSFGLDIMVKENRVYVAELVNNGPAQRAGLQKGDEILAIGDLSPLNTPTQWQKAREQMRAASVQRKKLLLRWRQLGRVLQGALTPQYLSVANVTMEELNLKNSSLARIRISSFSDPDTCLQFKETVGQVATNTKGIILDLRGNLGGRLDQANCVLDSLLPSQRLLSQVHFFDPQTPPIETYSLTPMEIAYPLVVLIDAKSASAAEVVAGSLQYHRRALLVGDSSFGKGSLQSDSPWGYLPETILLRRTVGYFLLPDGRSPQQLGVSPDVLINADPKAPREGDFFANALPAINSNAHPHSKPKLPSLTHCTTYSVTNPIEERLHFIDPTLFAALCPATYGSLSY